MKSLVKILAFTFLLSLGSVILVNQGVSAEEIDINIDEVEMQAANSIDVIVYKIVPIGGHLPPKFWYTKGQYGGYVYKVSYEKTPNNTYKGRYEGTLYLYAAPLKLVPEES